MQREQLVLHARRARDAAERLRYLIILKYDEGKGSTTISRELRCSHSTPHRVARRFQGLGEAGLIDGRCENGTVKADEHCYEVLVALLENTPQDYGWARPSWTRELLAEQIEADTGVRVSLGTVSTMLATVGARKGRPRPTVCCPWPRSKRLRRLREIQDLIESLPDDEVVLYEDEVDIDLNPKTGPDWMLPGVQKSVPTPGKNVKRYIAGALDARTGDIHYVEGERKRSALFVALVLWLVTEAYPDARRIHLVLDNFAIHDSLISRRSIEALNGKVVLHFLPPYCPNHNRIEPLWKQLHDNVTRNHRCPDIADLMHEVRRFLDAATPFPGSMPSLRRSA
jgi:transposase